MLTYRSRCGINWLITVLRLPNEYSRIRDAIGIWFIGNDGSNRCIFTTAFEDDVR